MSPLSTPKRKRSEMFIEDIPKLNTTTPFTSLDDGNASPRTRVARSLQNLALGGGDDQGGGGRSPGLSTIGNPMEDGARKRIKMPDVEMRDADHAAAAAEPVDPREQTALAAELQARRLRDNSKGPSRRQRSPKPLRFALDATMSKQSAPAPTTDTDHIATRSTRSTTTTPSPPPSPSHAHPNPRNQPGAVLSHSHNLTSRPKPTTAAEPAPATIITDPLRASLTWHDDEITIYDPDDSDDDGTGINGIGFKPTPAIAHARTMRRRQQLAEYRKREEREARAKRSQRRRGVESPARVASPARLAGKAGLKGKGRRVRFLEGGTEREGLVGG
ncbi:hypothetical protein BT67DRAFT_457172 [Trichocladium antarcticum]|uniref:Uncharacterized protein n=1 Tax=Trichocladium antarcticum TaxID=1450529 RepID=A0AAN6UGU7_9PEZI|nr:hypothetical protein BT67DRAFT_457172 [Trichocladium antarcticum]